MKTKKVFSLEIAGELARRGNNFIKTTPNYKAPGMLVYIFEDTKQLEEQFKEILDRRNKTEA